MDRDFVISSLYVPNHDNPRFYVVLEKQGSMELAFRTGGV